MPMDNATNTFKQGLYMCHCGWNGKELNWFRAHPRGALFYGYCPRCGRHFEGVFLTAKGIRDEEKR